MSDAESLRSVVSSGLRAPRYGRRTTETTPGRRCDFCVPGWTRRSQNLPRPVRATGRRRRRTDDAAADRRDVRGRRRPGRRTWGRTGVGRSLRTSSRRPAITARPSGVSVRVRYRSADVAISPAAHADSIHRSISRGAQAAGGFGIRHHPAQLRLLGRLPAFALLRCDRHARPPRVVRADMVDQELPGLHVSVVPQQLTVAGRPSRPARPLSWSPGRTLRRREDGAHKVLHHDVTNRRPRAWFDVHPRTVAPSHRRTTSSTLPL